MIFVEAALLHYDNFLTITSEQTMNRSIAGDFNVSRADHAGLCETVRQRLIAITRRSRRGQVNRVRGGERWEAEWVRGRRGSGAERLEGDGEIYVSEEERVARGRG